MALRAPRNGATQLSEGHRSRLAAAFVEIDQALIEATHFLDPDALRSPFSSQLVDATPVQHRLIADYTAQTRAAMAAMLRRFDVAFPAPRSSALQATRDALDRAVVAAEELGPRYMHGYGPLSDELEGELNRVVSNLLDRLDSMRRFLQPDESSEGVKRSERRSDGRPAPAMLDELARIVDAHRLCELRASLEAIVERLERDDLEIAVFGRVNAGKSSLLNHLLRTPILPVGAMPVTAVPVYVTSGTEPWGYATFADAAPEQFALGRLPEFVAEHFNPSNLRHVTRLRVELPDAKRLSDRVTLVDVPGIDLGGTRDELPAGLLSRCDIGLVLIDAAAGLTLDEAAIVASLGRAGSRAIVLVTKADLLPPAERWSIHGLVERGLASMIGRQVPVFLASTTSTDAKLRDDWIERGLEPLLARRDAVRARSLERKLVRLREAVATALQRRLSLATAPASLPTAFQHASALLAEVRALLDAAARPFDARAEADRQTIALIDEVAHNAALLWPQNRGPSLDITPLLLGSLEARAKGRTTTAAKEMAKLHARCRVALAEAGRLAGVPRVEATDLPAPPPEPLFDGAPYVETTVLRQPALAFLGRGWRRRATQAWLARSALRRAIADAMRRHFDRVNQWRLDALVELRTRYAAKSRHLQALHTELRSAAPGGANTQARALAADLELLKRFDGAASADPR